MMKLSLLIVLSLCVAGVVPAYSSSRWFSSSWYDLRIAMLRYARCIGTLAPLKDSLFNETEYLVNQMKVLLEQGSYENEQLANVTTLMDNICREYDPSYHVSAHIDVSKYSGSSGKVYRCDAINEAMDAMYPILKKASLNKSEPLDFSAIQFSPDASSPEKTYNLTDLINTCWIAADVPQDTVCGITYMFKDYIRVLTSNSSATDRSHTEHVGLFNALIEIINRILDPILGLQKRLYWDSNNRMAIVYHGLENQLINLGSAFSRTYNATINAFFRRSESTIGNLTTVLNTNLTSATTVETTSSTTTTTTTTTPLPNVSNVTV